MSLDSDTPVSELMEPLCPALNSSRVCLDGIIEGLSMCFVGDEAEIAKRAMNEMVDSLYNLVCGDEPIIDEILKPNFVPCVKTVWSVYDNCSVSSSKAVSGNECHKHEIERECLRNNIGDCGSPGAHRIVDAFMDPYMKHVFECDFSERWENTSTDNASEVNDENEANITDAWLHSNSAL
ncbi:uncharacterized protein LOC129741419 [Uranotaenia lowii]|uniref:uncharacterized protein LOC129741419 n=1 Tax=Uranotaenia lowii TaxID=190385 RepID=UPI002478B46E|nr:uncharacterized protein LOC129741419 [Uranotaenia lowii]XP_055589119.1 uncharacterized protein LOC129741419 [Uranotaenia lowii]